MSGWVHRLIEKDPETMRGVCQNCGDVRLVWKNKRLACKIAIESYRDSPNRRSPIGRHGVRYTEVRKQKVGKSCAICGSTENLRLDHCHTTKKVREFLCNRHNVGLGFFKDSIAELKSAIEYLEKHS